MGGHKKLESLFKKFDNDGSGTLDYDEFVTAMKELMLLDTEEEDLILFKHFDVDGSGAFSYAEFLTSMRGNLSDKRRQVVQEAFRQLDATGDGVITPEDIRIRYMTHRHPEVHTGLRTEEDIFEEFLSHFDTIETNNEVTVSEFERYYEKLSSLVEDDDYFVEMVRNTWHLPGAHSGHCLRVHISREDFDKYGLPCLVQEYVEIRPDFGLNKHHPDFFDECVSRLQEMGIEGVVHIEVLGRY